MKKGNKWTKRIVACVCSVAMAVALVPAVAFTAFAKDPAVLTVSIQDAETGATITPKGSDYTAAQLAELAAENTTSIDYLLPFKGGRVYTTKSYVTLDQLLSKIGKWTAGAQVSITAADGVGITKSYEDVTAGASYYYPNYSTADPSDEGKVTVPYVIALTQAYASLDTSIAKDVATSNASAEQSDASMQLLYGLSAPSFEGLSGKSWPGGVATITVIYPHKDFTVYANDTRTNTTKELASYTNEQLAELAKANTTPAKY